jgi:hypothetical protein
VSLALILDFLITLHACPVDQVEEQNSKQPKEQHNQEGAQIPQVWNDHVTDFSDFFDLWEDLLIGQTKEYCTSEKTQESRNQIIQLSFAATGGASTRSVTHQSHANAKD